MQNDANSDIGQSYLHTDIIGMHRRKRRRKNSISSRTSNLVGSYIDLEARDADSEPSDDDEEQDYSDFIDNTIVSVDTRLMNSHMNKTRAQSVPPDEIVQGIYARAKARNASTTSWPSLIPKGSSMHSRWSPNVSMYMISTPPSIVSRFISYLENLDEIMFAIRSPEKSSIIYVETSSFPVLADAINKWSEVDGSGECRWPGRPIVMTPMEQESVRNRYNQKQQHELVHKWVRIGDRGRDIKNAYSMDLVFIISEDEYPWDLSDNSHMGLLVPRIDYYSSDTQYSNTRTPAALFNAESVMHAFPENAPIWNEQEKHWKWSNFTFTASGLLFASFTSNRKLIVEGVQPTEDELALFLSSGEPILDRVAPTQMCALHPGDLVVINTGDTTSRSSTYERKVGYLIDISQESKGAFAKVQSHTPVVTTNIALSSGTPKVFYVPIDVVKHHLLTSPRILSIGDRVCVVAGADLGTSGRIIEFFGDQEVRILLSSANSVNVEKRYVRHDWRLGDVVECTRGTYQGVVGFIVDILCGGNVIIYANKKVKTISSGISF